MQVCQFLTLNLVYTLSCHLSPPPCNSKPHRHTSTVREDKEKDTGKGQGATPVDQVGESPLFGENLGAWSVEWASSHRE